MKTTEYFEYTRTRPDRKNIKEEWVLETIDNPDKMVTQEDGETVHNAFFDRSFSKEDIDED